MKTLHTLRTRITCMAAVAVLLCSVHFAMAQTATITINKTHLTIGDTVSAHLQVKFPKEQVVVIEPIGDSLGTMDIVAAGQRDSLFKGNSLILTQSFVVSAYDSGLFNAGPVKLLARNTAGTFDTLLSNQVLVHVVTVNADTSKPFKAIKAPLDVPYTWDEFLYYYIVLGILLVLGIGLFLFLRWRKKQKALKPAVREKPRDPAHIWANRELKKLEEEKLWQSGEIKLYYSRLTDILRLYLEYRFGWMALESTTEEITAEMGNYPVNDVARHLLIYTLRSADLVKFAKMMPLENEHAQAMDHARRFIDITKQVETKPAG